MYNRMYKRESPVYVVNGGPRWLRTDRPGRHARGAVLARADDQTSDERCGVSLHAADHVRGNVEGKGDGGMLEFKPS